MTTPVTRPPKQRVRDYMDSRTHAPHEEPLPTPEEIRRELGWHLLKNNDSLTDDES